MGGVVTRYALQSMEAAGRQHLVDLWLSVDAPRRGAYIPIGMQFLADLVKDRGGAEALAVADSPAAGQKSLVARSNVETKVAGYDVDTQVSALTSYIHARVSITGLLGLCESFAATAKAAIVKQAVDAAVAAGKKEAAPYTATCEKSFEAYGDGIQSEGAPGGRSNYIDTLGDALRQAGFSSEAGVTGGGTHMFVSVASALNIATPTSRMDATALQASSPFDRVYVESASNLDHLSSTSGYFAKEVDELFKR